MARRRCPGRSPGNNLNQVEGIQELGQGGPRSITLEFKLNKLGAYMPAPLTFAT